MNKSDLLDKGLRLRIAERGWDPETAQDLFVYPCNAGENEHAPASVSFEANFPTIGLQGGRRGDSSANFTNRQAASVRDGLAIAHRMRIGPELYIGKNSANPGGADLTVGTTQGARDGADNTVTFRPDSDRVIVGGEHPLLTGGVVWEGRENLRTLRDALIIICAIQGIE